MSKRKDKNRFVLDTFAILTYMKEEPGWQKVRNLLWSAYSKKISIFINYVNLGELYYIIYRENGAVIADKALTMVKLWPIKFINASEDIAIIAGRIKAENPISYADAYVVATALAKKATILTGDKEFKSLEELVDIFWLPQNR